VRSYFEACDYIGIDVAEGPNVDVVCQGQDYDAPSESFDIVISCEVMEHNPYWAETMSNMVRLCRPNGAVLMSCATHGRKEHGTTRSDPGSSPLTVELGWNYYRNLSANDFANSGSLENLEYEAWIHYRSYDLYLIGFKYSCTETQRKALREIVDLYKWKQLKSAKAIRRYLKSKIVKLR
jgi:2-polyprenyl-3-methyl-5-hydroxy-6-metoxy-1,4-benzoquinol methylase